MSKTNAMQKNTKEISVAKLLTSPLKIKIKINKKLLAYKV